MKAILEFNLPEDQEEYDRCNAATDMALFIFEFENYLREMWKHGPVEDIDKIYEKFFDRDFNLNKILS
jgi:hypothetical protein